MKQMQGATLLNYRKYRYLQATGGMVLIAIAAYLFIEPAAGIAYGATWLGYVFGILSTLIMCVLMWYGIAKRRTPKVLDSRKILSVKARLVSKLGGVTLQEWLSAHVYLGASLLVLVNLHTGFSFGWNVHTLAYVLMMLVIISGFYGLVAYLNYPSLITQNMGEDTLDDLLLKIAELDALACDRALGLPDEVNVLVLKARHETRVGGTLFEQLSGDQQDCPTRFAAKRLLELSGQYTQDDQPKIMRDLYSALLKKEKLVLRARTEIMLKARMECWLYLHAPLAIAMLAALAAHIVSVFYYW
jgi:hypothetical protein